MRNEGPNKQTDRQTDSVTSFSCSTKRQVKNRVADSGHLVTNFSAK